MSDISSQLPSELNQLLKEIRSSIDQLSSNQLHQLSTDRSINQESFISITNQIKHDLSRIDNNLDELEILADECEDESSRSIALKIVEEHRNDSSRLRSSLRTISLKVKQRLSNDEHQSSRVELLSGATPKSRSSNPEEALMSASSDVTQSLRHTLDIMRQELDRSVLSTHMLEQQTATLKSTSDQYFTFGELMKTSKALISTLQRADLLDRILLSGALLFFFLVCIYILKKRILDRGISLISTIISLLHRGGDRSNQMAVSTSKKDDVLTAAAAIATSTAIAMIPSLVTPDIPSPDPSAPEPSKSPLKPPTIPKAPSIPQYDKVPIPLPEPGALHEEL